MVRRLIPTLLLHLPTLNPAYPHKLLDEFSVDEIERCLDGKESSVPDRGAGRWLRQSRPLVLATIRAIRRLSVSYQSLELDQKLESNQRWPVADPPPRQLWLWGELPPEPYLAVVGPRRPSQYAQLVCEQLVSQLAPHCTIVSGLAHGIDRLALETALRAGGRVVAVVPTGVAQIYPPAHRPLARAIVAQRGAILSEYLFCPRVSGPHFVWRNRLIAALANTVFVPEAAIRSGTMTTARFALEYGRDLGVLPGDTTRLSAQGSNQLLKDGAQAILAADDLAALLKITKLTAAEAGIWRPLVDNLKAGWVEPEVLAEKLNLPPAGLAELLLAAQRAGIVRRAPDGTFRLG